MSLKLLSCIMFVKSKLSVDSELGYHRDLKKVGWHFFSNPIWLPKQRWPPCKNAELYTAFQKGSHQTFGSNFVKYQPILKILSLPDSAGNLL